MRWDSQRTGRGACALAGVRRGLRLARRALPQARRSIQIGASAARVVRGNTGAASAPPLPVSKMPAMKGRFRWRRFRRSAAHQEKGQTLKKAPILCGSLLLVGPKFRLYWNKKGDLFPPLPKAWRSRKPEAEFLLSPNHSLPGLVLWYPFHICQKPHRFKKVGNSRAAISI